VPRFSNYSSVSFHFQLKGGFLEVGVGWEQRTQRTWSKGPVTLFAEDCNVESTVSVPFLATLYFTSSLSFCNDGYNTTCVCTAAIEDGDSYDPNNFDHVVDLNYLLIASCAAQNFLIYSTNELLDEGCHSDNTSRH
jgi:hypothetical protein